MKTPRCFGRLYLRLNRSETPAMVFVQSRGRTVDSGTYWRVLEEGFDAIELTAAEQDWLISLEDTVEAHVNAVTVPIEPMPTDGGFVSGEARHPRYPFDFNPEKR